MPEVAGLPRVVRNFFNKSTFLRGKLDLLLVCTEFITSGESATSQCLSALTGQLGSLLYMRVGVRVCVSV